MEEAEKGLQMKEALHPKEAEMEEALHPEQPGQGQKKEEALDPVQPEQDPKKEEALHRVEEKKGLEVEGSLAIHGMEAEQTLHSMEAEVGLLQMEETRAVHGVDAEQETLHRMESEMGLQVGETLIHLLEAVVAEKRAETSRMRDERLEMQAAVEAKGNELEFLKTNRDRCVAEQLLLQDAEQLLHDILFPPN